MDMVVKHPQFTPKRLSHDLAVLVLEQTIDLSQPTENTACLPSCENQFAYQFPNGIGANCWVSVFQPVQHKLNLPLVEEGRCEANLKAALNRRTPGIGIIF